MKDLTAKLQMDANVAMGAIWMHIDAQAARIAELEAQIAAASAPASGKANEFNCHLTMVGVTIIGNGGENPITHIPGGTVVDLSGYTLLAPGATRPADTDKVQEPPKSATEITERWQEWSFRMQQEIQTIEVSTSGSKGYAKAWNEGAEHMREAIADMYASTALQAPVREVPEGWRLVPVKATEEWKDRLRDNGYCPTTVIDDVLTAAPLADELPGMWEQADLTGGATDCMPLPAAPVQEEGE